MKRSRINRRTPLRSNPDAQREWEERSRKAALAKAMERRARPQDPEARGKRRNWQNARRRRSEAEARRIYGDDARKEWMHAGVCEVCGCSPIQICHVRSGGMGRKADARHTIRLCQRHHGEQHTVGDKTFAERYGIDLDAVAAETHAAWLAARPSTP